MLAKSMERMALEAIGAKQRPIRWMLTPEALAMLRNHDEPAMLDAPRLVELDPPQFMGIPIVVGSDAEPVRLVIEEPSAPVPHAGRSSDVAL